MTATAAPEELAVAWLLSRCPAGRIRLGPGAPAPLAAGLVGRGQPVVVEDPDALRAEVAAPWLVRGPGEDAVPVAAAVTGIAAVPDPARPDPAVADADAADADAADAGAADADVPDAGAATTAPLLTIASLGDGGLTDETVERLLAPAPWTCVDDHLVVGTGTVLWVALWRPAPASDELARRLAQRLADAAAILAAGTSTVAEEVRRLSGHARNLEQQWTAARQGAQLAERMHGRLAREVADAAARAAQAGSGSPVGRLKSLVRSVRDGGGEAGTAPVVHPITLRADLATQARVGAPFRAGMLGPTAGRWLGAWVRAVPVEHGWRGRLVDAARHLEVVVVSEEVPGWSVEELRGLLEEAGTAGIRTVGIRPRPGRTPWFDGLVDVEVVGDPGATGTGRLVGPRPADPATVNPVGWRRLPPDVYALVGGGHLPEAAVAAAVEAVGAGRLALAGHAGHAGEGSGSLRRLETDSEGLLATLRGVRGVIDHPGLHTDVAAHAAWLAELALAAVPVHCLELPEAAAALLGDRLAGILRATRVDHLDDPDERERRTVLARRAAWLAHTTEARWRQLLPRLGLPVPRRRSFSLVLATNRPDFLEHCLAQAAKQRWPHAELVVGLHGRDFPDDAEERIHAATELPTTIVPVEAAQPLGEVLNRACQAASGDVVTKWDDDDWYSPDHLVDLAMALDYSGAQLVGKAAEFVYLADLDLTIRRYTSGAETASQTIAGGTMAIAREDLRAIGWWPHTPRTVDQYLIAAVRDVGGTVHRTHGFGYILNRHGVGHTWSAAADYFLQVSESQRRGLDLVFAGVEDG